MTTERLDEGIGPLAEFGRGGRRCHKEFVQCIVQFDSCAIWTSQPCLNRSPFRLNENWPGRTWRRWSFAHSLPPALSHLAEATLIIGTEGINKQYH